MTNISTAATRVQQCGSLSAFFCADGKLHQMPKGCPVSSMFTKGRTMVCRTAHTVCFKDVPPANEHAHGQEPFFLGATVAVIMGAAIMVTGGAVMTGGAA
eukprot:3884706-Amphidinium_carterae.1